MLTCLRDCTTSSPTSANRTQEPNARRRTSEGPALRGGLEHKPLARALHGADPLSGCAVMTWAHAIPGGMCKVCGSRHYPLRAICPYCASDAVEPTTLSPRGRIYSFSAVHRGVQENFRRRLPFIVALIELDDGPRVLSNVLDCTEDEIDIGTRVQAVYEELPEGPALLRFSRVDE